MHRIWWEKCPICQPVTEQRWKCIRISHAHKIWRPMLSTLPSLVTSQVTMTRTLASWQPSLGFQLTFFCRELWNRVGIFYDRITSRCYLCCVVIVGLFQPTWLIERAYCQNTIIWYLTVHLALNSQDLAMTYAGSGLLGPENMNIIGDILTKLLIDSRAASRSLATWEKAS